MPRAVKLQAVFTSNSPPNIYAKADGVHAHQPPNGILLQRPMVFTPTNPPMVHRNISAKADGPARAPTDREIRHTDRSRVTEEQVDVVDIKTLKKPNMMFVKRGNMIHSNQQCKQLVVVSHPL